VLMSSTITLLPLGQVSNQVFSSRITNMNQEVMDALYIIVLAFSIYLLCRYGIFPLIKFLAKKTTTLLDDILLDKKFLNRVSLAIVFSSLKAYVDTGNIIPYVDSLLSNRFIDAFLVIFIGLSLSELLTLINKVSNHYETLRDKPIKGYIQIVKIILNSFKV